MIETSAHATSLMTATGEVKTQRWRPLDVAFPSDVRHENPFIVRFEATAKGPDGETFELPGFYDGDGTWKMRISPTVEGKWTLTTRSDDPRLDGLTASFLCAPNENPNVRGRLLIDGEHQHHFIFEDGTPYFLVGYECDWLWALDMGKENQPTLNRFLDKLVSYGFNHILLNAYAHDTPWRQGETGPDDYGPPPMFPWEGTNEKPNHSRFNLDYWRHYDRVMQALFERGVVAHIMTKVYNKFVNWPPKGSEEDDLFFRWLIARYAAFPNVVWDFSKEAQNEKDVAYKKGRLRFIRENDPYRHLVTVHHDSRTYDEGLYDDLVDFRSDQNHRDWRETVLRQRRMREWPVVNVEFGYEHGPEGPEDKTYRVAQPAEEVARRAWKILTAGGYAAYYYTYTAWDVIRPDDAPPGYDYFRNIRDFFEQTEYRDMDPAADLVSSGYCLAAPGREYVVFLEEAEPVVVRLGAEGRFHARWFHALLGEWRAGGEVGPARASLSPPGDWEGQPVALHLRKL